MSDETSTATVAVTPDGKFARRITIQPKLSLQNLSLMILNLDIMKYDLIRRFNAAADAQVNQK